MSKRKFFEDYEFFWLYEYPFGDDFLKSIFKDEFQRKFSMVGDGIYTLLTLKDGSIYDVRLSQGKTILKNDGKKAYRDTNKDTIVEKICKKLKDSKIDYTTNSGKFICFKYNNFIMKIEIVKKAAMPQ